jgi:hypothetical protein
MIYSWLSLELKNSIYNDVVYRIVNYYVYVMKTITNDKLFLPS